MQLVKSAVDKLWMNLWEEEIFEWNYRLTEYAGRP
jgi:hypothetical protein